MELLAPDYGGPISRTDIRFQLTPRGATFGASPEYNLGRLNDDAINRYQGAPGSLAERQQRWEAGLGSRAELPRIPVALNIGAAYPPLAGARAASPSGAASRGSATQNFGAALLSGHQEHLAALPCALPFFALGFIGAAKTTIDPNTSANPNTQTHTKTPKNETTVAKTAIWAAGLTMARPGRHRGEADFR